MPQFWLICAEPAIGAQQVDWTAPSRPASRWPASVGILRRRSECDAEVDGVDVDVLQQVEAVLADVRHVGDDDHGSANCTPPFHWYDDGSFESYLKTIKRGGPCVVRPRWSRLCSCE